MKTTRQQLPIDESVKVPDAVKRNTQRIEDFYKAQEQPAEGADTPAPGNEPPVEPQKPTEPPVQPTQPPTQPSTPSATAQPPAPADDWQNRYQSMKGRFEKADQTNRQMSQRISHLESVLATMSATSPPPAQPGNGAAAPAPADMRFTITPEEEQEYGAEFLSVVGKKAAQIAEERTRELRAELDQIKSQVGQVGSHLARTAHEEMETELDREVPNWVKINEDPNFVRWLRLPDPYSGAIRHQLLKAAWDRADTVRVLNFFKGFLDEEAAVDPARGQGNPPAAPGNGTPPGGKPDLKDFAAPGRAKPAGGPPPGDEKPIISRAQISAFYTAVNAGKYIGNTAEKDRLEKMIFDAQREGRIQ